MHRTKEVVPGVVGLLGGQGLEGFLRLPGLLRVRAIHEGLPGRYVTGMVVFEDGSGFVFDDQAIELIVQPAHEGAVGGARRGALSAHFGDLLARHGGAGAVPLAAIIHFGGIGHELALACFGGAENPLQQDRQGGVDVPHRLLGFLVAQVGAHDAGDKNHRHDRAGRDAHHAVGFVVGGREEGRGGDAAIGVVFDRERAPFFFGTHGFKCFLAVCRRRRHRRCLRVMAVHRSESVLCHRHAGASSNHE